MRSNKTDQFQKVAQEIYKKNLELYNERKRAELLLYKVSEAIYATDPKGKITLFNHTLEKMLNTTSAEVIGKKASDIISITTEKGEAIDITSFYRMTENFGIPDTAILLSPEGKKYYVHIKVSVIKTGENNIEHLVTMSDITKEKELEKTKDDFVSIASHELRTPMSIIKSYLWMLSAGKGGKLSKKQAIYVEKSMKSTDRMIALINDMLNISRIEEGRVKIEEKRLNLDLILPDIIKELEIKTAEKDLYLKLENKTNVRYVYGDRQKIREIFVNLVGNAIKFTQTGGITVKIERLKNARHVKFSIIDTGKGISSTDTQMLFKKFQRLENSYKTVAEAGGTGLGLYIVKLYVSKMGGEVGVFSGGPDKGSTFWFTLPTTKQQEDAVSLSTQQP